MARRPNGPTAAGVDPHDARPENDPSFADLDADFDADFDGDFDGNFGGELAFDGELAADHRGAFGDFGGDASGTLIDRTFRERIVIVGLGSPGLDDSELDRSLDELELLVDTAGADVTARLVQRRDRPESATYIGKGKVEELKQLCYQVDADTVVFDDELTPGQQFNLEKLLGRTVIDRTAVILDIFGQNASSLEGKAQVELALLRYRLPRLRGKGISLSQQRGGVGTRQGGGETKLEVDRRRILRRIHKLERDLTEITANRRTQRRARQRSRLHTVAIVGYTNAGKSTLLNCLTDAGVLVEDRLFATLDSTTRRLALPGGESVLVTDTVGFVAKLPHHLVEAFKSTLEVVGEADLLVHVVDASAPNPYANIVAVRSVLEEIGANSMPELLVFNKADLAPIDADLLARRHPGSVAASAVTSAGIDELLRAVGDQLRVLTNIVELLVPYARGDILAEVHREGEVLSETAGPDGMEVRARVDDAANRRLRPFFVVAAAP